jgi:single-stranded DNA-binding protein
MTIDVAFYGFLAADAESRTSQAGKNWVRFRCGVGKDDSIQWVSVAVFGKAAEHAADLKKADRVYVEGSIKLDSWRGNDRIERHGLSVAAFKCERTHNIGRNHAKKDKEPGEQTTQEQATAGGGTAGGREFDDNIPF